MTSKFCNPCKDIDLILVCNTPATGNALDYIELKQCNKCGKLHSLTWPYPIREYPIPTLEQLKIDIIRGVNYHLAFDNDSWDMDAKKHFRQIRLMLIGGDTDSYLFEVIDTRTKLKFHVWYSIKSKEIISMCTTGGIFSPITEAARTLLERISNTFKGGVDKQ